MIGFILRRLVALIPTVAVPMVLLFLLLRLTPGDPAATILGDEATAESIAALRAEMGLDQPLAIQFVQWLGSMVRLDFGSSIFLKQEVTPLVLQSAGVTFQLAILSMIVAVLIGPALGAIAASVRIRAIDKAMVVGSAVGIAIPTFWFAILMILTFGVTIRLFPVSGYTPLFEDPARWAMSMAMPVLTLGLLESATLFRYSRNGVLDARNAPFVTTARAQGLPEGTIISRYIFRLATVPVVTVVGLSLASLLGGAVITEKVFGLPGLGALLLTAVGRRDYPVIEGSVFLIAVIFVIVNLLVDIVVAILDPRIRLVKKD